MKLPSPLAGALPLQPLDLATESHDLGLERGQHQIMPRPRQGEQARQPLGFGQGGRGLGKPAVLI